MRLTQLRASVVERFAADLERAGAGRATIVSTLAVLQGVMKRAVRDYNLPGNPVKQIDKPSQRRELDPVLVTVEQVEAMRLWCLGRDDVRSATLISLLAYAGPRPQSEALPLRWSSVRRPTILFRASKRGVPYERATRLLAPLAGDLRTWREACGLPPDDAPVIPSGRGEPWADYDWDNWRGRTFRAAAKAAGLRADADDGSRRVRPRDLRSSFATLLIYEGQPPQYVAEQLGHSAATLLRDYARVWEDFDPSQRVSAEEQIEVVRGASMAAEPPDAVSVRAAGGRDRCPREMVLSWRCSAAASLPASPRRTKPPMSGAPALHKGLVRPAGWNVQATRYGDEVGATVSDTILNGPSALAAHHPVGVSTGIFEDLRGSWQELVAEACKVSTYAIELSALSEDELPGLVAYLAAEPRLPFRYVSVHAPVKDRNLDEAAGARVLSELPLWVRSIVTHPDALEEPARYRGLGTRLVLENMDDRKRTGRTAGELEFVFDEVPEAGFCLDVAHASSIDPAMHLAEELLDQFRSRLRQVHVSSLRGHHHVPLTADDEERFARILKRCRDVPWILEARPPDWWLTELKATRLIALDEAAIA